LEKGILDTVKEYVKYYNTVRPHSSLGNVPLGYKARGGNGRIRCDSRLGGIIKHYYREQEQKGAEDEV